MSKKPNHTPPLVDILLAFQQEYDRELHDRLVLYASNRCNSLTWNGVLGGAPVKGKTAEDFVQEAIQLFLQGKRKWNPDQSSLKRFLEGVIRSITNHISEASENRSTTRGSHTSKDEEKISLIDRLPSHEPNYEEKEDISLREERMWKFMEFLKDDQEVLDIFEKIYDGIHKPAEIAKQLSISVEDVYKRKKRLSTKVDQFKKRETILERNK